MAKKMVKKAAAKKTTTTKRQYEAKVAISPRHDAEGEGVNIGDKVSAKRAEAIAATEGAKLSDLFK